MKKRIFSLTLMVASAMTITMTVLADTSFKFTENGVIYTIDGKNYTPEDVNKMGQLPANVEDVFLVENGELINYFGSESSVVIPNTVKIIGDSSVSDRSAITKVTIGNSVTTIGMAAFRNCKNLKSVNISSSVTIIGDFAFQNCTSLREIKIPSSVKSIGEDAFAEDAFTAEQTGDSFADMSSKPLPKLVVIAEAGSYAEKYAKENGLTCKTISAPVTAKPLTSKVSVNGVQKTLEAYTISGSSYFKIGDLASLLKGSKKQFNVTLNSTKKEITMQSNKTYKAVKGDMVKGDGKAKTAALSTYKISIDGKEIKLTVYTIAGGTYFNLNDIMQTFNVGTVEDTTKNTITINTSMDYAPGAASGTVTSN